MFLLPSERDLAPAAIGLRLFSRDAARRAGRPYAIIGGPNEAASPSILPWWAWITIGGVIVGLAYLTIRRRSDGRDRPAYVLLDSPFGESARDYTYASQTRPAIQPQPQPLSAATLPELSEASAPAAAPQLHPFSDDSALSAAFDRDVEMIWTGRDPWTGE